MGTKYVVFEGPVEWAQVFESNRDMGDFHDAYDGQYSLNMILDSDNLDKFIECGAIMKPKKNENGETFVKFRRKHIDRFPESSGPPRVLKNDGTKWDIEEDGLLGNGTVCKVKVSFFQSKAGVGHRLETIVVKDHVVFESSGDRDSDMFDTTPVSHTEELPF